MDQQERNWLRRNIALTDLVFGPLFLAFVRIATFCPVPVGALFVNRGILDTDDYYFEVYGKTASGQQIKIPPISLTGALSGRCGVRLDTA